MVANSRIIIISYVILFIFSSISFFDGFDSLLKLRVCVCIYIYIYMGNATTHPPIFMKVCFSIEHLLCLDKTLQLSFIKTSQTKGQICKTQFILNIFFVSALLSLLIRTKKSFLPNQRHYAGTGREKLGFLTHTLCQCISIFLINTKFSSSISIVSVLTLNTSL
jgi:hypothetical protein